jgi:arylsulfatase A-like enzyme
MREGSWKLVVQHPNAKPGSFENERVELYRLDRDPGEQTELAAQEPERTAHMLQQLKQWYTSTQKTKTAQPGGW